MGDEIEYEKAIAAHTAAYNTVANKRMILKSLEKEFEEVERQSKVVQLIGQTIGEILSILPNNRYIVRASTGPRYIVGICQDALNNLQKLDKNEKFARVSLDTTTLTIMRILPREVNPMVANMVCDSEFASFDDVGGLNNEIREFSEIIKKSLEEPEIFERVGVAIPKGVLLYGPPGTGKTLLARCMAAQLQCKFIKIVASAVIEKYIGESARLIREMFAFARANQPCVIFFDEIDAIGGKRLGDSSSSDREVQRTLMELLAQLDGFDPLTNVKVIMATNRPDILDDALLRPGRLDRKIEIPLPNESGRKSILKIHSRKLDRDGVLTEQNLDLISKITAGFNGADLRNLCTEAGLATIRADRDAPTMEDFVKAARKLASIKKLESQLEYKHV